MRGRKLDLKIMLAADIRRRFLDYFSRYGHSVQPSSSLVPANDPTLLFTNAGMVQFKRVFLGHELPPGGRPRAATSQKCVRAGGKHNDLEQVGHTDRHNTFFEMLGNFSFGDYFKREAITFAWEFITKELGIPAEHLRVSVFQEDDEARALWRELAGLPDSRIYGLGAADNFWQMADTGPCGPCSEMYIDLAAVAGDFTFPPGATGEWTDTARTEFSTAAFIQGAEEGRFLEFWNLVFMQFDRQEDGTNVPLPRPSVDTGMGLERIATILQGVSNNFHTDLFLPLIGVVEEQLGERYLNGDKRSASFRVIADHARSVAFLLADGVFPANDGRGYVLRRILRRAVRHAWLLGRREPLLVHVVEAVIEQLRDVYPELHVRKRHILDTTRAEEDRFLSTVDGGMARFDEIAPLSNARDSSGVRGIIAGEDAFRLYDTYGFPIDLTELMARERGFVVDLAGFEASLAEQRQRSQQERRGRRLSVNGDVFGDTAKWQSGPDHDATHEFVGYDSIEVASYPTAVRYLANGRVAVVLRQTPFYAESGGQISDRGEIVGEGWRVEVDEVRKVDGRVVAIGEVTGTVTFDAVIARVRSQRRHDTERNHTATHLLHAALRSVLGEHVHQAGSLVDPDRIRFDFTHHGPLSAEQLERLEQWVNAGIWSNVDVLTSERRYADAVALGATALFGEKYGDVVRVVEIVGLSTELCGGCHVRNTAQIGLFRIISEGGVSAGVRRIVAVTGPRAFELMRARERSLEALGLRLKVNTQSAAADVLERKLDQLLSDRKSLERQLADARKGEVAQSRNGTLMSKAEPVGDHLLLSTVVEAVDLKELHALGDSVRTDIGSGVGILGAAIDDEKGILLVVVGDRLRERGVSAAVLLKAIASRTGARGGGKPHMAQAGLRLNQLAGAIQIAREIVHTALVNLT